MKLVRKGKCLYRTVTSGRSPGYQNERAIPYLHPRRRGPISVAIGVHRKCLQTANASTIRNGGEGYPWTGPKACTANSSNRSPIPRQAPYEAAISVPIASRIVLPGWDHFSDERPRCRFQPPVHGHARPTWRVRTYETASGIHNTNDFQRIIHSAAHIPSRNAPCHGAPARASDARHK